MSCRCFERGQLRFRLWFALALTRGTMLTAIAGFAAVEVDSPGGRILKALNKKRFFRFRGGDKVGESTGRELKLAGMVPISLMQFGGRDHHLPFRTSVKRGEVLGIAGDPTIANIGKSGARVIWVVTDRHAGAFDGGVAKNA